MLFDVGVKQMNQRIGAVVALVAMVLLALLLVSVKPELPLMFQKRTSSDSEYLAPIFSAPIVVVAVIQSDTLVHGPTASDQHSQLRKLQVRVENVLRGEDIPGTGYDLLLHMGGRVQRTKAAWHLDDAAALDADLS